MTRRATLRRVAGVVALGVALALGYPAQAHAGPIVEAIAVWVVTNLPFISEAVDTFLFYAVQTAIYAGATWAVAKLTTPGQRGAGQDRQASVLQVQLGESPRECLFGEAATGGSLVDAFDFGGTYGTDNECLVIACADHRCKSLEGFYIGDTYYPFAGNGVQPGFNSQLSVYFFDGSPGQAASTTLPADSGRWTTADRLAGVCYAVAIYKADDQHASNPVWSTGRPQFLFRIKGAYLYDPRKDDTVAGGAGPHRIDNPATWEWGKNAALCRYRYQRGFYFEDDATVASKLMIGRGLTAIEAPPENVIPYANLCDEAVTLKAGGTEARYEVSGVIRADEHFEAVEEMFAAAMGGQIVQPAGGIEVEPGHAKSVVLTITDDNLLVGYPIQFDRIAAENARVNTVTPRYIAPDQLWRETAAPIRRSTADIEDDGGVRSQDLSLSLVTSQTQAQRCGEIVRRLARLERRMALTLGPAYSRLEEGDWIAWTSARYFGGATVTFRIEAHSEDEGLRTNLLLREIESAVYDWNPAVDEGTPGQAPVDESGSLTALSLAGAALAAFNLVGADGSVQPGFKATWTTPVDKAVTAVRVEVRKVGTTDVAAFRCDDPNSGAFVGGPLIAGSNMEGRLIPVTGEWRKVTASAWLPITTAGIVTSNRLFDNARPASPIEGDINIVRDGNGRVTGIEAYHAGAWVAGSTSNKVTASASPPASPTVNDVWVVLDGSGNVTGVSYWTGSAWSTAATRNSVTQSATAPSNPVNGDVWVVLDANGRVTGIQTRIGGAWVSASTRNAYSIGTVAPATPTVNDIWVDTTTSGKPVVKLWNGSTWVNSSIPAGVVQYLDPSTGRLNNFGAFPCINVPVGFGLTFDAFPFTSDDTHIYVASCHLTSEGFSRTIPAATINSLTPGTIYGMVYQWVGNFWNVCDPQFATAFITSVDLWLYGGQFSTTNSGVYPTPNTPAGVPGGYGGFHAGQYDYNQP